MVYRDPPDLESQEMLDLIREIEWDALRRREKEAFDLHLKADRVVEGFKTLVAALRTSECSCETCKEMVRLIKEHEAKEG